MSQYLQSVTMASLIVSEDPFFLAWEAAEEARQVALYESGAMTLRSPIGYADGIAIEVVS